MKAQSGAKPKWEMQHVFDKIKPLNIDQTIDVCWLYQEGPFIQQQAPQYGLELLIFFVRRPGLFILLDKTKSIDQFY